MYLIVKTITSNGREQTLTCWANSFETLLEYLEVFSSFGDTITQVSIIDGRSTIHLPVEAIDGQPIRSQIELLEQQWREILSKPVNADSVKLLSSPLKASSIRLGRKLFGFLRNKQSPEAPI